MEMGTGNVQGTAALNNVRPAYNFVNHINSTRLSDQQKRDMLVQLTGKREAMVKGAAFMLKNPDKVKFDHFETALTRLNNANNSYSLQAVETALQKEIDTVRDSVSISNEDKNLCVETLDNMISALSDYHLKNGQENTFVPQKLQNYYKMMAEGSARGLDWDKLNNSVYSTEFRSGTNPTWKFLDDRLVKQNLANMTLAQKDENLVSDLKTEPKPTAEPTMQANNGMVDYGTVEVQKTQDNKINQFLDAISTKFNAVNLQDQKNICELFNFVKGSVVDQNSAEYTVNYPVIHKLSVALMHRIVDIGNDQQRKAMTEQNQVEERAL